MSKRAVTVTADAQSKSVGALDPALTYQITSGSLVSGDTFSGSLTREAGETAGTYAILQGTLALSSNYALTYVPGVFTISNLIPIVTTDAATLVTTTGATLNGTVSSNGSSTAVTFDYGLTTAYGSSATATESPLAAGASGAAVSAAVTGLACNTLYHFRVKGVNSNGTSSGGDLTFTTSACAPTATTNAATSVTDTGATLNGAVSSNGASTTVTFDYGLTTGYGSSATAAQSPLATGASGTAVSAAVTGLACNTLYHFRVKGVNSAGTTNGGDLTFTTSACPPGVTLTQATGGGAIPSNTAPGCALAGTWTTLTGPIIAETAAGQIGAGTIVLSAPAGFEFNTAAAVSISLAGSASASKNINNLASGSLITPTVGATAITFSVTAISTAANTLTWQNIQVRPTLSTPLAAGNITHTGTSAITGVAAGATNFGTLTEVTSTPACAATAPTVTTNNATALTISGATLNGTVSSNGASTTVTFDYGLTTSYGSSATAAQSPLAASAVDTAVSAPVTGLTCGTTYHFRAKGVNSAGTTNGLDGTFTTSACLPPTATTNPASGITSAVAMLNGTVSSNSSDTTVSFEYGLTAAYGNSIAATPGLLAADAVNTAVSADLVGLNCNTVFHYRVVATNSAGTSYGANGTFTTGLCSAPFPATACAATRFNGDLSCTAADVSLTNIALAPLSISSCVSGAPVILDLDLTLNFSSPNRWDIGVFIANDGKLPTLLPANGGAGSCSVDVLPLTAPFLDLDGIPQGTLDTCGDGNNSINGGTGSGVKRMSGVTLPCYASPASGGKLFVPFVVSWDNQRSPIGNLCTSNLYPVPNTSSKCNAPASSVSINVVVLPVITKTNGGTEINPGASTAYTVTIFNNSGGTLLDMVFTDPAVTNLTVNSVSCAATGATCPTTTVAAMQGAGISIPSANLPNNGTLTFTINATLSGTAAIGSHLVNTATVTLTGGSSTSATDDDLVVLSPSAAKSFAPSTITEGAASVLTVTLTNPTATAVTGVSFTDAYPSGMVNTASANGATTCGGTVTAANNGSSLVLSGGTIPANGSCTVTVNVTSATAGSYTNSTGAIAASSGAIPAASATLTVDIAVYGGFNACDDATDPNVSCTSITTPTTSHITTKISDSPFTLDLVALKTNGTWDANYGNDVIVELLDASDNSGALDAYNCRSTWTTVIATLGSNPSFASSNGQITTATSFTVPEAYRDVRVRVRNNGGSTRIGCSTDNFAIRPNSLAVSVADIDWGTTGTTRVLNNTDAAAPGSSTGNPAIHKAGQPFTITATAKNASNVTTANYAGTTPAAVLGDCSPAGTACIANLGVLALGAAGAAPGVVSWSSAAYSEVGAFNLTLQDTSFASVDAADTAASCAGYYVCSAAIPVGRFVPDHFDTAVLLSAGVPMTCPAGLTCPPLYNGFVYSGQPFSLMVTARNASGNTTVNYDTTTSLAKTANLAAWGELGTTTAPTGAGALDVSSVADFSAGTLTEAAEKYTFSTALTAPADIYVRATDTDGVTSLRTTDPTTTSVEGGVKVVSGRIKIANAHGSELLPLPMTATVQYYNGTYWATSATDSVTSLTLGGGNYQYKTGSWTVTPPVNGTVSAGVLSYKLSSSGGTGSVDISASAPAHLLAGNNGASVNPSNTGRATFGVYKGNNEFIYLREVY